MKNCDFRNAVIGRNGRRDPVWPFLNESNTLIKKRNRPFNTPAANSHNDPTHQYFPTSSATNDSLFPTLSNAECKDQTQIESNFPELSKSLMMKKELNQHSLKKSLNSQLDEKVVSPINQVARRTKIPKFRNEISVSLSSLIKTHVIKKKTYYKKINTEKVTLNGNKLDGDRPIRRKGKSRLIKKKHLTQYKKDINLCKSLKKKYIYDKNFHKAKCFVPCILNCFNNCNIEKLETLFTSMHIEELKKDQVTDNQMSRMIVNDVTKTLLHSKKFRKYCTNLVTPTLLKNVENLVVRLRNLQDKQHAKDPCKTFAKRRYLCGFRETKRFILCDSVKAVIVATNLEIDKDLPSGTPLNEIIDLADKRSIPLIFAGYIKQFGYWTLKKQKISIISVLRYEGAEQLYNDLLVSWEESKKAYDNAISEIEAHLPEDICSGKEEISLDVEQEIRNNIISKLSIDT